MMLALKKRYWNLHRAILNSRASVELSRLNLKFIPWTSMAIQPASMMNILNEIFVNQRNIVIEFGCGVSTLYIARALSETGGRLISIENDSEWTALVRQMLAREGLEEIATLVNAPLKQCSLAIGGLQWYDEETVRKALGGIKADMVLVDGPPAREPGKGLARYPALPAVLPYLANRCVVLLDDIDRPGEQDVLARWRALHDFDFDVNIQGIPNFVLLRRGAGFDSGF